MLKPENFTKIKHDIDGNPRYVCHYLNLLTEAELDAHEGLMRPWKYAVAVDRSHRFGGRKFHNKQYGGGIVFSTYSLQELCNRINAALRLSYLRGEIEAERISYSEIAELQELADYIDPSDTLLLEWAGVPEK